MANLIDSYSETNKSDFSLLSGDDIFSIGQTFVGNGQALDSCKFYLAKNASPTGNAVAKLYAITGTPGTNAKPTGSALAISDNFDVTTLTSSFQLITFTFSGSNRVTLSNGTNYFIAFEYTGGDAVTNYVEFGVDSTSPTDDGNMAFNQISAGWGADTPDAIFYVYSAITSLANGRRRRGIGS